MGRISSVIAVALVAVCATAGWAQRGPKSHPNPPQSSQQDRSPNQQQKRGFVFYGPGPHRGDWLRRHSGMSLQDQERALQKDPDFQKLKPEDQQRLRDRLQTFRNLPPDQQRRILGRMETLEHLPPGEQREARQLFRDFRNLPQDRRGPLVNAFRDLRKMSPDERDQALNSDEYRNKFSKDELDLLRGMGDLKLPPESQDDSDH